MTKARTAEILLGHVRVNTIADYYDIPQLKELANTKIQHIIEPTGLHTVSQRLLRKFSTQPPTRSYAK
jgi:hypothetical protein